MSESKARQNKAVALRYQAEEDMAPVVIAAGYGEMADRIINLAEQQGIPVFKDDSAVSLLCMLDIGKSIPPQLYEVVASIYVQLLEISQKAAGSAGTAPAGLRGPERKESGNKSS